jgi:HD-GYP domain-containing protein (c-di-GMP phosphodiesterase class II)
MVTEDDDWLELVLAVDTDTARQRQLFLSPAAARLLDLVIEREDTYDFYHGWDIKEWAEILGSTLGKTHEALQELDDAGLVSKV